MGKFAQSKIHSKYSKFLLEQDELHSIYSDFSYDSKLYQCDIDRTWVCLDYQEKGMKAVMDLKWDNSKLEQITNAEEIMFEWFEAHNVKVYIVYLGLDEFGNIMKFRVRRFKGKEKIFTTEEYISFIRDL